MRLRLAESVILAARLCSAQQQPADEDRDINLKKLVPNIVEDQKSIWSFPRKLSERRNLVPTIAFVVIGTELAVGAQASLAVLQELRETAAQTAKEAAHGDRQAQRLLAKESKPTSE